MIIVCEGVDNGGKTTLVKSVDAYYKEWCIDHGHPIESLILKQGQPDPDRGILEQYELDLEQPEVMRLILSTTAMVLCDRWHVGELIYGPIYRDGSRLSEGMNLHVEMFLDAIGALKLLVQPSSISIVHRRFKTRGDDFLKPQHVKCVYDAYEAHGTEFRYMRPFNNQPSSMVALAHERTNIVNNSLATMPTYVGHPQPQVLLVGDQRNDGLKGDLRYPRAFTPWQATGSSRYLMDALLTVEMHRHHTLAIVNANEPGVNLTLINDLESQPAVVALGSNASAALMAAGVEHERVPHPQWWRRFRNHHLNEYAEAIKAAAGITGISTR